MTVEQPMPDVLAGWWISEDRTRLMVVRPPADSGDVYPRVWVWDLDSRRAHAAHCPARWRPAKPEAAASENARARLGYLQVELGAMNLGRTYDLMVATHNDDATAYGGYAWRPLAPDTPRIDVRLFPEGGASYYEAVLGYYDDVAEQERANTAWNEPLSTWLPIADQDAPAWAVP